MSRAGSARVVIVDYGMGNLFSVEQACRHAGVGVEISPDPEAVLSADAVVVPGVGAFGSAMDTLRRQGLDVAIRGAAARGTLVVGICLGMQLLMEESEEFGCHAGLGLIPGRVVRFPELGPTGQRVRVPQVCWNQIFRPSNSDAAARSWEGTLLDGQLDGAYLYFVHSYYVEPSDRRVVLSESEYAGVRFCSSVTAGNVAGCQFHPERSGVCGLAIYRTLASMATAHRARRELERG